MAQEQWAGKTYGNGWMHKCLIWLLRFIDVRILYLLASVFVIPVCLILNPSRKTAYRYFREIHKYRRLKAAWATYINHCKFAQVVIDRFAMYAGKKFKVTVDGMDKFNALAAGDEGFLHLSSHIGNYEIAGYTLVSERKTINAVVYGYEKASVMANRNSMFTKTNIRMIALKEDMSYLFEINEALCNGDIVSFPADRFMGETKCIEALFMGKTAKFPQGPFSVAAMRGLDVLAVNVMKTGLTRYKIFVTPLQYEKDKPRKEKIRQLSQAYVAELEKRIKEYPTQWYNFFDFWN